MGSGGKTKKRSTRRLKRTRRRFPRRKRGGYNPATDNGVYPTKPITSYPMGQSGALPDPKSTPNVFKHSPSASGL